MLPDTAIADALWLDVRIEAFIRTSLKAAAFSLEAAADSVLAADTDLFAAITCCCVTLVSTTLDTGPSLASAFMAVSPLNTLLVYVLPDESSCREPKNAEDLIGETVTWSMLVFPRFTFPLAAGVVALPMRL